MHEVELWDIRQLRCKVIGNMSLEHNRYYMYVLYLEF